MIYFLLFRILLLKIDRLCDKLNYNLYIILDFGVLKWVKE